MLRGYLRIYQLSKDEELGEFLVAEIDAKLTKNS